MACWIDRAGRPPASGPDHLAPAVAVVVPAHDEERLIGRCLQSLHVATNYLRSALPQPPTVHLVVVLDACSDGTEKAVADDRLVSRVRVHHRGVGPTRRAGAQHVLQAVGERVGWLASTDADSEVPEHWLAGMVDLARSGADLVLGTVQPWPALTGVAGQKYRAEYQPWRGHRHVHGANLGISVAAYRALGGWPPVACQEDVVLVRRAETAGLRIVRTHTIPVRTSSRLTGRAPAGFASHLKDLAGDMTGPR